MLRRMRMRRRTIILGTAMALALLGCSGGSSRDLPAVIPNADSSVQSMSPRLAPAVPSRSPQTEFVTAEAAKALWRSRGVRNYSVVVERDCSCATRPFRIVVREAQAVEVRAVDGSDTPVPAGLLLSVDDMFDLIERFPPAYDMQYDPAYGFPRSTGLADRRDQ